VREIGGDEVGLSLARAESGLQWRIGDWLNYGERKYGDIVAASHALKRWDEKTLWHFKWLSSVYEPSRRREGLSWSHHQEAAIFKEVAALERDRFPD
jgi:hypothetical protein